MKRSLLVILVFVLSIVTVVPIGATRAAENTCTISAVVTNNHVEFTVTQTSGEPFNGWAGGDGSSPFQFGNGSGTNVLFTDGVAHTSTDYDYKGGVFTASISGPMSCSKEVTIVGPDVPPEPPQNGGNQPASPVGNAAFIGHGVDDCRFFVDASAKYYMKADKKLNVEANSLFVTVTKMGTGSRPFTVYVESIDGKLPWHVQSDPDLSGEGGVGSDLYHLPFDEVLKDKTVKQVYVSVFNAITGVRCDGPFPVSIR